MSRLYPPAPETYTDEQKQVHESISSGPRGGVRGPLGIWLWRPELAKHAQALGRYCRYDSSLDPKLSELTILVTGRFWLSEYEWQQHKPFAIEAGLSEDVIESLRVGETPKTEDAEIQIVYEFASELLASKQVSQPVYERAVNLLGRETVVDLVGVLGYYTLISMTINVFEVEPPGPVELS